MTRSLSEAKILLVNDDGIDAPGLAALRRVLDPICQLTVVAPLVEKSGSGCGLSVHREMAVERRREGGRVWGHAVDGTPADCVKFALKALDGYRPDLVLSGVNRGANVGNSVWYSGTVAGALEATMFGLRAMAVSLDVLFRTAEPRFDTAARITVELLPWLLAQEWKARSFWNLNVPNRPLEELAGVRYTHQGTSFYTDNFKLVRKDGEREYYSNVGESQVRSPEPENSDDLALEQGAAALSMLCMDLTVELPRAASQALEREWNQFVFGRPGIKDPATI